MPLTPNAVEEVTELANYVAGFADSIQNRHLARAAEWLHKLKREVCGKGYIGCRGGRDCDSDHK